VLIAGATNARAGSVSEDFAAVLERIARGEIDPEVEIRSLLLRVSTAKSASERDLTLEYLTDMGRADGRSPQYIKQYLRVHFPPVALTVARDAAVDWAIRGRALMALRTIDASEAHLREAIEIARADRTEHRDYIASRGNLLVEWLELRLRAGTSDIPRDEGVDKEAERIALEFLRTRGVKTNYDQLKVSIGKLEPIEIEALFIAGAFSQKVRAEKGEWELWQFATSIGCSASAPRQAQYKATIESLTRRNVNINGRDALNNSPLLLAGQYCALAAVRAFVESGAKTGVMNKQGMTELSMAIMGNRWDVAAYLVDQGSRLPKKSIDELFIEPPDDPVQKALLVRATEGK
jgi:hypothetical protein